jgi:pimeloyl-ACP methyl ester carboxylesterase
VPLTSVTLPDGHALACRIDDFTDPWTTAPETVLFVHGLAERGDAWTAWVPAFARHFRVVRWDQRGFGASGALDEAKGWRIEESVEDLADFARALGIERFHLVSAKLGGTIAMAFAAAHPEMVRSLSIVSSPASLGESLGSVLPEWTRMVREHGVRHWAAQTMGPRLGSAMPAEGVRWWTDMMGRTPRSTMLAIFPTLAEVDVRPLLPAIRCPALVVTTTGSRLGTVDAIESWQRTIAGSRLLVLETDSYHVAASHPDLAAREVLDFIRGV